MFWVGFPDHTAITYSTTAMFRNFEPCRGQCKSQELFTEKSSIFLVTAVVYETPGPFAGRYIFCGNRLYQNKYEMSDWVQEARAKGITDPGEVWRYARQKEISIHGA